MATPVFVLSLGYVITIFLATIWNTGELLVARGGKRLAHLAVVSLIIVLLASLGLGAPEWLGRLAGAALVGAALCIGLTERGRSFANSLLQMSFGGLVAAGLPYAVI